MDINLTPQKIHSRTHNSYDILLVLTVESQILLLRIRFAFNSMFNLIVVSFLGAVEIFRRISWKHPAKMKLFTSVIVLVAFFCYQGKHFLTFFFGLLDFSLHYYNNIYLIMIENRLRSFVKIPTYSEQLCSIQWLYL